MDHNDYNYDVAFSLLEEDKALATEINDLIRDRMSTFVYWEHQIDLAGKDGVESLGRIFGKESRVVVILYRDKWGTTQWTGVEERVIKDRGVVNVGYDFAFLIVLEKPKSLPNWFPKTHIWLDLERYGTKGAAAVIEARVREAGSAARAESVIERAARLSRQLDAETNRKQFLTSPEGSEAALHEVETLLGVVETLANQCEGFAFSIHCGDQHVEVCAKKRETILVEWSQPYPLSLEGSGLSVQLWQGTPFRRGRVKEKPHILSEERYSFDRETTGALGWRSAPGDKPFLTSQQLGEKCLEKLMDYVHKQRMA